MERDGGDKERGGKARERLTNMKQVLQRHAAIVTRFSLSLCKFSIRIDRKKHAGKQGQQNVTREISSCQKMNHRFEKNEYIEDIRYTTI